jgi:hypothetical protein
MNQLEFDIIKTIEVIYLSESAGHIFPYPRTIFNILKGNSSSVNAQRYLSTPYYGLYKELKFSLFNQTLEGLVPRYLIRTPRKNRLRYQITPTAYDYLIDSKTALDQRFFNHPDIDALFSFNHTLEKFSDDYFEKTFQTEKGVTVIKNNKTGDYTFNSIEKTVTYESNDERLFLEYLDENKAVKSIKTQSLCIHYQYNNEPHKYYPDFVIHTRSGHIIICEVKALINMSYHMNIRKYEVLKAYCKTHGYGYGTIGFKGKFTSYEELKYRHVSSKLNHRVRSAMQKRNKFTQGQYDFFKESNSVHPLDIHSIVLKNNYKKVRQYDAVELKSTINLDMIDV